MLFNIFKRKRKVVKDKYKKALNYKMAHPEKEVLCPKCGKVLEWAYEDHSIQVKCTKPKCIMGTSRGIYKYQ